MAHEKRLARSKDQWIAGVCGGIAEFLGWKPDVVRLLWVLGTILSVGLGGLAAYVVLWLVMPPPEGNGPVASQ